MKRRHCVANLSHESGKTRGSGRNDKVFELPKTPFSLEFGEQYGKFRLIGCARANMTNGFFAMLPDEINKK